MFITLLSKFEIFIGTLLTTKNNPLTMDYKTLYEAELTKNKILQLKNKELNKELEYDADTSFADLTDEIKKLKEFRDSVIDTLKYDDDVKDSEIIDMIDEMENDWDPNHYQELKEENKELKEQIFGINDNDMKIEGFAEQVVRLGSENKILKDKSKGFKTLFREVKKLTKELEELKESSSEEESSEEEEELMSPDEYTQDWLETMLFPDDVGDAERFIVGAECQKGYQDILEGDMARYYDDNRTKMCPKMKAEWREEFPHADDDIPYFHDNVGVLADVIEDYYLNKLKIPKSKMDEWRDSYQKEMYGEEEEEESEEEQKKKFLERHDISEDDMKEWMKQCGGRI